MRAVKSGAKQPALDNLSANGSVLPGQFKRHLTPPPVPPKKVRHAQVEERREKLELQGTIPRPIMRPMPTVRASDPKRPISQAESSTTGKVSKAAPRADSAGLSSVDFEVGYDPPDEAPETQGQPAQSRQATGKPIN